MQYVTEGCYDIHSISVPHGDTYYVVHLRHLIKLSHENIWGGVRGIAPLTFNLVSYGGEWLTSCTGIVTPRKRAPGTH